MAVEGEQFKERGGGGEAMAGGPLAGLTEFLKTSLATLARGAARYKSRSIATITNRICYAS